MLMLRGGLGFLSVSALFFGLQFLPLADATAFTFLAPVFVALLSPYLLGEHPPRVWPAVALCLLGVVLVTQPEVLFGTARLTTVGVAIGIVQPFAAAMAKVLSSCVLVLVCASFFPIDTYLQR